MGGSFRRPDGSQFLEALAKMSLTQPNRCEVNDMTLTQKPRLQTAARSRTTAERIWVKKRDKASNGEAADGAAHPVPEQVHPARNAPAHLRPFRALFPGQGRLTPRHPPPRQLHFQLRNRNRPLTPTVRWKRPLGADFPLFQLWNDLSGGCVPKLNPLYTPRTAGEKPNARGPVGVIKVDNPRR